MRVSADPSDEGFRPDAHLFDVLLNGQKITGRPERGPWRIVGVTTADEEDGVVFCSVAHRQDKVVMTPEAGLPVCPCGQRHPKFHSFAFEGKVEIRRREAETA